MKFELEELYEHSGYWHLTCSFNGRFQREYTLIKGFEVQAMQSFISIYTGWSNGAYTSEQTAFTAFETNSIVYVSRFDGDDD